MNFTNKVANLLIWFWTTFIIPALNLVKSQAATATAAVQTNLNSINEAIQNQLLSINTSIDNAVDAAENVATDLSVFQTTTNSSISNINSSISAIEGRITTAFVDQVELDESAMIYDNTLQQYTVSGSDLFLEGAVAGIYTFYLGEGTDYQSATEEGIVKVKIDAFPPKLVDESDDLSIVWNGSEITSVRVIARKDAIIDEESVKGIVADYMAANPFTV